MKTPTLFALLEQNSSLTTILSKAKQLAEINLYFHEILADPTLSPHYSVANYHSGTLVVFADSAAWRLRLEFLRQKILSQLQEKYPEISALQFRTTPTIKY